MISCFVFIAYAQIGYEDGLVGLTVFWSTVCAILLGTFIFARRWQRANHATPVEYLERRYGSGVRHDYFRRLFCRWIAGKIAVGDFPDDIDLIKPLLERVSYLNSKEIFK